MGYKDIYYISWEFFDCKWQKNQISLSKEENFLAKTEVFHKVPQYGWTSLVQWRSYNSETPETEDSDDTQVSYHCCWNLHAGLPFSLLDTKLSPHAENMALVFVLEF